MSETAAVSQQSRSKPVRPTRTAVLAGKRRAEAKLYRRAIDELTALTGGHPSEMQQQWIVMAAGLVVTLHGLTLVDRISVIAATSAWKVPRRRKWPM
jgi:hypothetical protein